MALTLSVDVDSETLARAREAALARGETLERLVTNVVRRLGSGDDNQARDGASGDHHVLDGMFSDDPELIDNVIGHAMEARERDALRAAP